MRKWVASVVLVTPLLFGAVSSAQIKLPVKPPAPTPTPTVQPKLQLLPYIATARRALTKGLPTTTKYAQGALSYDVEIVNPLSSDLTTTLLVERLDVPAPAPQVARVPVQIAAGGRAFVTFTDAAGLLDGCRPTRDRLTLESGTSARTLVVTPECSFEMSSNDPTASLSPDRRLEQRRGKLWYHSAKLVAASGSAATAPPVCGIAIVAEATARNDGPTSASNVRLRFVGPNGASPSSTGFDLGPGKERALDVPSASFAGHPGSYVLRVEGSGVPLHQPGWNAQVTRSCSLEVTLER